MLTLHQLLEEMIEKNASDLHLTANVPPQLRVDGEIVPTGYDPLSPEQCETLIYSVLRDDQRKRFEMSKELDLSFGVQGLSRFRVNVFSATRGDERRDPEDPLSRFPISMNSACLPSRASFAELPNGLVLVTGPTGSGKSTTLAALIDRINANRAGHIITIEDPIEYLHPHKRCIVNQREVNSDTKTFAEALKYVLRQDPDVILIGEMRDLETIAAALTIAETGHLVFATLHTNSTFESINRIVDVFPSNQQRQVLSQLAFVLKGVITQQLIQRARGGGRVNVSEVLVCTPAVSAVDPRGEDRTRSTR